MERYNQLVELLNKANYEYHVLELIISSKGEIMDFYQNHNNCECKTKCYLVKVSQNICYYPINWNCDRKKETCCNHNNHNQYNWEQDFESKYWNGNHFDCNQAIQNKHKCCCKNSY